MPRRSHLVKREGFDSETLSREALRRVRRIEEMKTGLLCALVVSCFGSIAAADYSLTILHTNDFHARFEPINKFNSTCSGEDNDAGVCFGGSARLITAIEEARARHANSILLDGGDQFQGTLFYTYYKGKLTAEMMNRLGYDAMTVGNHEFDDGPEVLRGFMDAVQFPVLMSNADVSREVLLAGVVQKSTVIERDGEKLGLIGLTPQDNDDLASPGPNVIFTDPVDAVQGEVDRLTSQGINKIILLSHSGFHLDLRVAEETTGVDVIVGGHSHTYLNSNDPNAAGPYPTMVGDTAIVQAYAYGKFLGELNVRFDAAGHVVEATGAPLLMDAGVTENAAVKARIAEAAVPLDEIRNKVVAETGSPIGGEKSSCRQAVCEMGVAVAEAMLARVQSQGIEVALQNGGGVRASIDAGAITMGEVLTVLPFQNTLSTFQVDGSTILAALENGVSQVESNAGRFPQVAGMRFTYNPNATAGARIRDVIIGDEPLDPDRVYGMVSNNYIRNGGDGYAMFRDAEAAYDFGPDLADVLAEYFAQNTPFEPMVDDRIKVVTD